MFTGLVDAIGIIQGVQRTAAGRELRIESQYRDLVEGESVAVNGACLTVREAVSGTFTVAATGTTLERTSIGTWEAGKRVNLERALRFGDRLGGHLVQGHVDCVGSVEAVHGAGDSVIITAKIAEDVWDSLVTRGSVSVDGVSLTVHALPARGVVEVSLIEYTLSHTTLADLAPDDDVHIEGDILGKYVQRILAPYLQTKN
jgi:riboflavin synthase